MRMLSAAVFAVSTAAVIFLAGPAEACTNPESGAGDPGINGRPGRDGTPTGTTGTPPPSVDMPRPPVEEGGSTKPSMPDGLSENPGPAGQPSPSSDPAQPAGTGGGDVVLDTGFVEVSWTPAKEVDGDPNTSGYWGHAGHRIATRVQITNVTTQAVVLDETVSQYDYGSAVKGGANPARTTATATLPAGRYQARVQSVFVRHDETRFGMEGTWVKTATVSSSPAISNSVPAATFVVRNGADAGGVVAGCSTEPGVFQWMLLLVLAPLMRRRPRS